MSDLTGSLIGHYQIISQLGEGGMATVYRARDMRLEREVAIKVIRTDTFAPAILKQVLARFEREAKSLAKLSHPNIVGVIDYGEENGQPYLVMEYLPGGTLKDRIRPGMTWQQAVRLLLPIAEALRSAHADGIIHRDIKPTNILLTHSGEPMLTDFGIAKVIESEQLTSLTGTGLAVGTPDYMAPEQWQGNTSQSSDIYALGVVLYEMITGKRPYSADTPIGVLLKQTSEPLPRPRTLVPELPWAVENVIVTALERRPEDRFSDMGAFAAALHDLLTHAETPALGIDLDGTILPVEPPPPPIQQKTSIHSTPTGEIKPRPGKKKASTTWVAIFSVVAGALCMAGLLGGGMLVFIILRPPTPTAQVEAGLATQVIVAQITIPATNSATQQPTDAIPSPTEEPAAPPSQTPTVTATSTTEPTIAPTAEPTITPTPLPMRLQPLYIVASDYDSAGSVDAGNNPITYVPENALDADPSTAWRVAGDGNQQWLEVRFGSPVTVAEIGIIPGYDKIDPYDNTDRFTQNRVVKSIQVEFSDGTKLTFTFAYDRQMQYIPASGIRTNTIRITVLDTYPPQSGNPRDFTPISEIEIIGWE
jgi:serine/threonine protein kinase